jgi:hypothetical protein
MTVAPSLCGRGGEFIGTLNESDDYPDLIYEIIEENI